VARILSGDLDAFETLYHRYERPVFYTALAITGDRGAAEEVLQDCFVRAYAAMGRVDASTCLAPWLHRIAVRLSCNWIRGHRHWPLDLDALVDRLIAGPVASPEFAAEDNEVRYILGEAVAALGAKHRAVITLYYFQEFTLAEMAYILECPLGTVKSRLNRACKTLRIRLSADRRLRGEAAYATYSR